MARCHRGEETIVPIEQAVWTLPCSVFRGLICQMQSIGLRRAGVVAERSVGSARTAAH